MYEKLPVLAVLRHSDVVTPEFDVRACRKVVGAKLRSLGPPRDMGPHARIAANIILSNCRQCGRCEHAL